MENRLKSALRYVVKGLNADAKWAAGAVFVSPFMFGGSPFAAGLASAAVYSTFKFAPALLELLFRKD